MISGKHASYNTFVNDRNDSEITEEILETTSSRRNETIAFLRSTNFKNRLSFWFLGLCNDFGYWIILSSAHDLLSRGEITDTSPNTESKRQCNQLSAGIILLVNIAPNFIMKSFLPYLPLWIHARIFIGIILSIAGFAIAACNQMHMYMILGVGLCSVAVGIWTSSFLMYIPSFKDDNIVKAWCSGCGSSGFFASLIYLLLTTYGIDLSSILSYMMIIPPFMALIFWFLLEHPIIEDKIISSHSIRVRFSETFRMLFKLVIYYTAPYFLVFFFQYLINQGLFELIFIKNNIVDLATQVRLFTFIYLLAVLLSSSCSIMKVDYLWLMVLLQGINLVLITMESIYGWAGNNFYSFWIVVGLIFWEGLIAGCSYFNTYRRINHEIPTNYRQFSMSMNSIGASLGMIFAGFIAIPLHNYICNLPPP